MEVFNFEVEFYQGGIPGVMGFANDFYPAIGTNVNDGKWQMIACTFDGSILKIYVDGILDNIGNMTYNTSQQFNYIGKSNHTGAEQFFNGTIDDVSIYN